MAIVKYSGVGMVAGSGKLQGTVLLNNNVIRVWHKTKTVRDTATNLVKGIFAGVSAAYKSLTPSQLLAWQTAAVNYLRKNALAEVKSLTGNQAFQRVNNILISLGLVTVASPPGIAVTDTIVEVLGAATAGVPSFGITVTTFNGAVAIPANTYIKVYGTPGYTPSKQKFSKSNYRLVGFLSNPSSLAPLDILVIYGNTFGALVAGQRIGFALEWIYATPGGSNLFKQNVRIYGDVIVAP